MKPTFSQSLRFLFVLGATFWACTAAQAAAPVITNITMVGATPQFAVQSDLSITNQIQYCTNLNQTNWVVLTNLLVVQSPYWFADVAEPPDSQRFYRVAALAATIPLPSGMALIPAGNFTMGNCMGPSEGFTDELPLHTVNVSAFYMDTNLVSYALWQQVYQWAANNGYSFTNAGSGKAANHPVQTIDWYDCVKWCNARSEKGGLIPCYYTDASQTTVYRNGTNDLANTFVNWTANGYRLPTEAEWEKAARGGVSGHRFPWSDSDTIDWSRANCYAYPLSAGGNAYDVNLTQGFNPAWSSGGYPYTTPVGSFAANGYGLYDMAGNVFQSCWDWYDGGYYNLSPGTDPRGPGSSPYGWRVLRGGSWVFPGSNTRCADRDFKDPYSAFDSHGLRCVRGL
jgi:formylglycine-generating enzyme